MYQILKKEFCFIATRDIDPWRKEQGWDFMDDVPYLIKVTEQNETHQTAIRLSKESEVVMVGAVSEEYIRSRLRENKKGITLRYSERIYKRGSWRVVSPRGWILRWNNYYKYNKRNLYMLCASAYTSRDLMLQGSYLGKCYKWGYFPETKNYTVEELRSKKSKDKAVILWCGRFLDWKHPEIAITLASRLKEDGIDFELQMIGNGEQENNLRSMVIQNQLDASVKFLGAMSPEQVRSHMEKANIFLFTSDYQEGWGAVLNEAMNSGCAIVASHAAGAVPYLMKDGINGFIYRYGDMARIHDKVKFLISHRSVCEELGLKAYETIIKEWNAKIAAKRLLLLIDDLNNKGYSDRYQDGPCSKAEIIKNNWFKEQHSGDDGWEKENATIIHDNR